MAVIYSHIKFDLELVQLPRFNYAYKHE